MISKSLLILFLILFQVITISPADKIDILKSDLIIYDAKENYKGYLALPGKEGKFPAIILIHEWWGLTGYVKERAKNFAELGYAALAVDLYNGRVTSVTDEAKALSTEVRNNPEKALNNLKSAINYLKNMSIIDPDRIASIGWCFGGGWSYQMAKNNMDVKVSIIYYGQINPKDDLSNIKAVILGNFGGMDQSIKVDTVKEFKDVLSKINKKHEIYIYPKAGHAFDTTNGANFNKEASGLAWSRSIEFIKKYL